MPISVFKKGAQGQLDMQEVFNIWNLVRARYFSTETIKFFINFVHDREFDLLLVSLLGHYTKQVGILEKEAETFKIKVPERPPFEFSTSVKLDMISWLRASRSACNCSSSSR